ncbi:hemin uptake protein HemP [Halomonas sp. V046]|uniref:hemin uptake protein HemP n=1 Tax=Halomonas sp. V046 TaxID=3459611 RepID=UPI004043BD11
MSAPSNLPTASTASTGVSAGDAPHRRVIDPQGSRDRRVSSDALLGEQGRLIIEHRGQRYHLRRTRNDKLILTT